MDLHEWMTKNGKYYTQGKDKVYQYNALTIMEYAQYFHEQEMNKLSPSAVSVSVIEQIREAFSNYRKAEGCSCCRDDDAHKEAEKRLAELLKPIPYEDGSGFDWWQYCTEC